MTDPLDIPSTRSTMDVGQASPSGDNDGSMDQDFDAYMAAAPDWTKVMAMVGAPDYAVMFSVWPWPDGGWMAGVCLMDREWAEEQELPAAILALTETPLRAEWNPFDGFAHGINTHFGGSARDAVEALWKKVVGDA